MRDAQGACGHFPPQTRWRDNPRILVDPDGDATVALDPSEALEWRTRVAAGLVGSPGPAGSGMDVPESQTRDADQMSATAAAETVHSRFFGITAETNTGMANAADAERIYLEKRANGVSWAIVPVTWRTTEATQGQFNWTRTDRAIRAAACENVQPVIQTIGAPEWAWVGPASGANPNTVPPKAELNGTIPEFRGWIATLANRYGPTGAFWQAPGTCIDGSAVPQRHSPAVVVWNEQNTAAFWGGHPPFGQTPNCGASNCNSVVHYKRVLRAAWHGVGDSGKDMSVITGGLTGQNDDDHLVNYLRDLHTTTIPFNSHYDVLGVHPYAPYVYDQCFGCAEYGVINIMETIRTIQGNNEAGAKGLWVTEMGVPSCYEASPPVLYTPGCAGSDFNGRNKNELQQADYLTSAFDWLTTDRSWYGLGRIAWYGYSDLPLTATWLTGASPNPSCSWCEGVGLRWKDFTEKLSQAAYRDQVLSWRGSLTN